MKRTVISSLALLSFSVVLAPALTDAVPRRCVPGEIIVKFRGTTADTIEEQLRSSTDDPSFPPLLSNPDRSNAKYPVSQIRPLLRDFRKRQPQLKSLREENNKHRTNKQEHILKRLRRVPTNTKAPNLGSIYRIQLDCESRQSLEDALAEFRNDPESQQPGDLDRNGIVNTADLALLTEDWLKHDKPSVINTIKPHDETKEQNSS